MIRAELLLTWLFCVRAGTGVSKELAAKIWLIRKLRKAAAEKVAAAEKDKEMVQGLLDLRARLDDIHASAFAKNDEFKRSLKVR